MNEDALIARYIEENPRQPGPTGARLRDYGTEVWALIGYLRDAVNGDVETAAADYERQVNLAVQSDPDVQAFVERLEQAAGDDADDTSGPLPSGESIARDLQRFLRQRGNDEPPHPSV